MKRGSTGRFVTTSSFGDEKVRAFVPLPLPPKPALTIGPELRDRLDSALLAVGRLDSVTTLLPDTSLFLYMYVRKEAVLSSQIEGTQSSLSDLLLFEAEESPGVPLDDVMEVSNYVAAMEHGLKRIKGGFPLSNRLIREIHAILLANGRGSEKSPGDFRRSQNWLGGSRPGNAVFVPPPPHEVHGCMGALERWLHDDPEKTPTLLKAALAHVQFETIHPFLDGNGRVGRLLITLLFCVEKFLRDPMLYLSLYLKRHRDEYYMLLDRVRREGDWEAWISFFADGVIESAAGAAESAHRLVKTASDDRDKIQQLGRAAGSSLRVHHAMQQRPVATAGTLASKAGISAPSVLKSLDHLQQLGIVRELTGRKRNRVFSYAGYVRILSEGTEPLKPTN
jgi:Fic family protein